MNQMRELFEKWAKSECLDTDSVDGFYSDNDTHIAWGSWQASQSAAVPVVGEVDCYDAGLLSDFGGGNVEWWQDYIRAELARAHEFYASQSATEAIPIVGKTVGYLAGGTLMRRKIHGYDCKPLIVQPATSISADELARLRRCRELLKEARDDVAETLNCMTASYRDSPRNKTRIDKQREFLNQIDAAIAGETEHG